MEVSGNSLYAQMQNMSLQAMGNRTSGVLPGIEGGIQPVSQTNSSSSDFGNMLTDALSTVSEIQKDAGAKKTAFTLGDRSVTLAETMIATSKAGIAFEATVQVRNKFVEAYKEIMSMPV